jgi:hypothetical protein
MEIGIIGLPTSGKTTVFNALTGEDRPTAAASTGQLDTFNLIVEVPDERLDQLNALFRPRKTIYAKVTYVDIAGLDQEFGKEGLPGALRNKIATMDAFIHVIRAFESDRVPHPLESVDPQRDLEIMHTEMILADLITVENRLERIAEGLQKGARGEERQKLHSQQALFERLKEQLEGEVPLRDLDLSEEERDLLGGYGLLTLKPTIVLLNAGDTPVDPHAVLDYEHADTALMTLQGQLEMEIGQLDAEERELFMEEFGIESLGATRVIQTSYALLGLHSFFTIGDDEIRAWTLRNEGTAIEAAGTVHTDLARGFIRAEVIPHQELLEAGDMTEARRSGKVRLEGKEYVVQDGDVIYVRFSI